MLWLETQPHRLTDVNGVHFVYDADGALIKKTEGSKTTTYIGNYFEKELAAVFVPNTQKSFGSSWKIENFALPGGKTRKYYYFGGQRVAVRENNAAPQWIHGDHLGSASITTDNAGAKVGEMRYTPFGGARVDTGDAKGNKRFQGAERVASIELDLMLDEYWKYSMKTPLSKPKTYRLLIEKYLQNAISASRLQKDFFRHMKVEPEGMDKKLFLILNDLFEDLDAYSPHWKPEDESPFRLTESSLRKEVQQAANQLDALIEELELKKDG